jgi:hypothetical protein
MGPQPQNNDGRSFTSPDKRAEIAISGIFANVSSNDELASRLIPSDDNLVRAALACNKFLVFQSDSYRALLARHLLDPQLPENRFRECILDCDHDVLVFGRIAVSLADEDILMLRHRDANIDLDDSGRKRMARRAAYTLHDLAESIGPRLKRRHALDHLRKYLSEIQGNREPIVWAVVVPVHFGKSNGLTA